MKRGQIDHPLRKNYSQKAQPYYGLYMIPVKVSNQKTTINNKVRLIEQIFVLDTVK